MLFLDSSKSGMKAYYISVHLNNNANRPVSVKWKELETEKQVNIPDKAALVQEFTIASPSEPLPVMFTAHDPSNEALIPINNRYYLPLQPTLNKNTVTANIGNGAGQGKTYYIGANVRNNDPNNVTLKWVENGEAKETVLQGSGNANYQSQFLATTPPGPIAVKSNRPDILINGEEVFNIQPKEGLEVVDIQLNPGK